MEAIFLQILNMSITGSYIILAVMILRLFLKKAPKKYSYLMWAVCAFRLCCPVSFKNIFSIFNLRFFNMPSNSGAALEHIPKNIGMMNNPAVSTGLNSIDNTVNSSLPAATPMASVNPLQIIIFIAAVIWIIGIAALLLYSIISYIMLRVKLRNSIIYKKNVYQSDKISSPFVFGLINPKIYIPFNITENEMDYVLSHEQYHIKRRDYIIKPIAFLILVLHWFNPLCWLAFMLMSYDMEMSCDEKVLSNSKARSKEYSKSLLSVACVKRPPSPCPLAFGETRIKGRIKNILKYRKPKIYVSVISVILCTVAIIACASNPNKKSEISYDNLKMSDEALTAFCENIIGSMMADIDYADSEKIVFHYNNAIFVYNHQAAIMEKCFDINNLNCARFQQGDYGADMIVSADGKEALLVNYGSYDEDFKNYIINLENGSAAETVKTELSNPFSNLSETYTTVSDSNGWTSTRCAAENDNIWYLTCEDTRSITNIKLCLYRLGKTVWDNYIFENKDEVQQSVIKAALPKDAEIIVNSGAHWTIGEKELQDLRDRLADMFSYINDKDARADLKNLAHINPGMYDVWFYGIQQGKNSYPYYLFIIDSSTSELLLSADLENADNMLDISATLELYRIGETPIEGYNTFYPQDIYSLSAAHLIIGKNVYSILDKGNLRELEETLSNAEEIKGGTACPFDAVLQMTRTDGTEGMVLLASDSCAMYRSGGVYYDYSDGDNSRLLSMFGLNSDTLVNMLYQ